MRIAIIADIHANLPALEAVLEDLDNRRPDAVYCLGDLIGYNIWPNEVIEKIRGRRITTIAGHDDLEVVKGQSRNMIANDYFFNNYPYAIVGDKEKRFLMTLPRQIRLTLVGDITLLLVHGSPRSINECLLEDLDRITVLQMMKQANADIICCGHSHKPYHRVIQTVNDGNKRVRQVINVGSVGKPGDGDTRACYAIITTTPDTDKATRDSIGVEFVRVAYDLEKAARAIEASYLPKDFAAALRNGQ